MLSKKPVKGSEFTSVTFRYPAPSKVESVRLLGEFNDWRAERHSMKRRKDGSWSLTVRLPRDQQFRFRYLVDGTEWVTDESADGFETNEYGGSNGIVRT